MFIYKGRTIKLLSHYVYDDEYEEFRREIDVLIASILDLELKYEYDYADNHLKILYLNNGNYEELPYYTSDTTWALSLFKDVFGIRLIIDNKAVSSTEYDMPLGEWKVIYEYEKTIYLPGSGSYYRPAEALVRAWLSYKNVWLIHKYPEYLETA